MVDVVIASCSEDEALARLIAERAAALGLGVWRSDLTSDSEGAHSKDACEAQIGKSGAVLVCWSDHAIASKSVLAEANDALWQQKLVACRLSPCILPSPFDSIPVLDLIEWDGRIEVSAWKEIIAAIAEKLHRPGLIELLQARISGDESGRYSFATRFPDEPQAREIWAELEAKYREECASTIRDARRYFEQRAATHQQKIDDMLKSFAKDFQAWLERERRGESSPKPSLNTLLDIWLKGGLAEKAALEPESLAPASDAGEGQREAQLSEERQLADEAAKAALVRAEQAEAELAETRAQLNARKNAPPATKETSVEPRSNLRHAIFAGATLLAFGRGISVAPILRLGQMTTQPLTIQPLETTKTSEPIKAPPMNSPPGEQQAAMNAQKSSAEVLQELLEAHRDETISRVIGYDPQAVLAKLLDTSLEDVVKASASKMPTLAVGEALKASMPQAMAPVAQLPPRDLFKALQTAMPAARISEFAKLFQAPPPPGAPSSGANYKTFDNLDIESSDVTKLKTADLKNCSSACRQKDSCKGYTFDKWNRVCYLKSNIGEFKLNPRSSSGVREDVKAPKVSSSEIIMEHYHMKAFPGLGYKSTRVDKLETCELFCRTDEVCVAYTFHFDQRSCQMFNSTDEYSGDNSAESGGKRQE
jgi:hypothetical protein